MEYSFMEPFLINDLINGVSINYEQYNNRELVEILTFLNRLVKNKKNIFCFEKNAILNYKKIVEIISNYVFDKEILVAHTMILYLEEMLKNEEFAYKSKQEFIDEQMSLRKINVTDDVDNYLKKCIDMDKKIIVHVYHRVLFWSKKNKEELDLIRSSVNYFYNCDESSKDLYDEFVNLYKEKNIHLFQTEPCKILEFPLKKQSLIRSILKG